MSRHVSVTAAAGVAGLLLSGMAGSAQAVAPVEPVNHYSGSNAYDTTDCGLDLHVEVTFSGMSFVLPAPGSDEAFLGHNRYQFSETITLTSEPDGPYVTTQGSGNLVETSATLLDPAEPTIYQFTSVDAGSFRLYSSDRTVLVSSSGVFKATTIYDTLGDRTPGAEFIEEVTGDFHGNESGDFCKAITAALT